MKYSKSLILSTVAMLAFVAPSFAKNITIDDTQGPNSAGWGAAGKGQGAEDQETEPGTATSQSWDLEAFTLNDRSLKIYSGFDLLNGNNPYALGDLFIGRANVAKWDTSSFSSADSHINGINNNSVFKYDYVIHFNNRTGTSIGAGTYDVYQLSHLTSELLDETQFKGLSNPFKLSDRSLANMTAIASGTMNVAVNPNAVVTLEDGTQVTGGSHFVGEIDLSTTGIMFKGESLFHLTMGCGNDNLIGRAVVPDGGTTLALMGFAVSGLSMFSRRMSRKS